MTSPARRSSDAEGAPWSGLSAGLGLKLEHLDDALAARAPGLWFEVHAENYMMEGGPRLAALMRVRAAFEVSIHSVGLSLVSAEPPDPGRLAGLRRLIDRVEPVLVSDHLAWQRWDGVHHNDFLPFPRTLEALSLTCENVHRVQDAIGRPLLIENPSLYIDLPGHAYAEAEFLSQLAAITGCGLLLDVNNLYVSARNLGFNAESALDAFPAEAIGEIHLAGHSVDSDPSSGLLIDSHGAPVADPVFSLYRRLVARIGPRPTLIERDADLPPFGALLAERGRAHEVLAQARLRV